jgi:hypothetical protein
MSCQRCGWPLTIRRARSRYCSECYAHLYAEEVKLGRLPGYHPFIRERRARVQRLRDRAEKRLPLFKTDPDHSTRSDGGGGDARLL